MSIVAPEARRRAFEEAVAARGLTPTAVVDTDFTMAGGAAATTAQLEGPVRPTPVLYAIGSNERTALLCGVRVPEEVSVVGFDGTELARHTWPALTTIRSDPEQWGAAAARTLLALTSTGSAPDVELAPAELVTARSTGPAPARGQAQGT